MYREFNTSADIQLHKWADSHQLAELCAKVHTHAQHSHASQDVDIVITEGLMNSGVIPSREEVPIGPARLCCSGILSVVEYSVSRSQTLDSLIVCTHFAT